MQDQNKSEFVKYTKSQRMSAFFALLIIGPGSFLFFFPHESLEKGVFEALVWIGAIGFIFLTSVSVIKAVRGVFWHK